MPPELRSKAITEGIQRTPNRAMLRAVGFGDADFDKPIIGVANSHSTITPCNANINDLANCAADSIETVCNAQAMDGLLAIGGCDKNMPGAMIAIARLNIPSIFVYAGTIKP